MSLPGVLAPHGRVLPAFAERTDRPRPSGRTLGVLVALALGAMAVIVGVVPQVPVLARAVGMAPAAPAPAPVAMTTVTAVVTATASCVSGDPHDQVVMNLGGRAAPAVLDGCGRRPGTLVPVVTPADGHVTGPVAVAGSGAQTPTASTDLGGQGVSPLVARLELALAVAAALGAGALAVVVARGSTPGSTRGAPGVRPPGRASPAASPRPGGSPPPRGAPPVRTPSGPPACGPPGRPPAPPPGAGPPLAVAVRVGG